MKAIKIIKEQGHLFYVKHPNYRGSGTVIYKDEKFYYLPEFKREFLITENDLKKILAFNKTEDKLDYIL